MRCLLCKGKKNFMVKNTEVEIDFMLGGTPDFITKVCPRCNGVGFEMKIPSRKKRLKETMESYTENYNYFYVKEKTDHHKTILKKL